MMEFPLHSAGCSSVLDCGVAVTEEQMKIVPFRQQAVPATEVLKIWLTAANVWGALQSACQLVFPPSELILTEMTRMVAGKPGSLHP
jgi:hypothetical protein